MYRLANLIKRKESEQDTNYYDLDVCVQKEGFKSPEDAFSKIGNNPIQTCIGSICFHDLRDSNKILMDFAFQYRQCLRMGESKDGEYYFARYQKQFEPFIISSFVHYFSEGRG